MHRVEHQTAKEIRDDHNRMLTKISDQISTGGYISRITVDSNKISGRLDHNNQYTILKLSDVNTYDTKYYDKKLVGWVCEKTFQVNGFHTVLKLDREGKECVRLSVYGLKSENVLPLNSKVTVYEPYFKKAAMDNKGVFRVDNISDLRVEIDKSEHYKQIGNDYFNKKEYNSAIEYYTKSINEDDSNYITYCNRSNTYFNIGEFDNSYYDAMKSIQINDQWFKGYFRVSKALYSLNRCMESYDFICKALLLDQDTKGELKQHFELLLSKRKQELTKPNPLKVIPPPFPNLLNQPLKSSSPIIPLQKPTPSVAIDYSTKSIEELVKEIDSVGSSSISSSSSKKKKKQPSTIVVPPSPSPLPSSPPTQQMLIKGWKIIQNGGKMGKRYNATAIEFGDNILIWGGKNEDDCGIGGRGYRVGMDIDIPIIYNTNKDYYKEFELFKIKSRINHSMVRVAEKLYIIGGTYSNNSNNSNNSNETICIDIEKLERVKSFKEINKPSKDLLKSCSSLVLNTTSSGTPITNGRILILDIECNLYLLSPITGEWSEIELSKSKQQQQGPDSNGGSNGIIIKPPKRKFTYLTSIGVNERYILLYGGSIDNIVKYKDMWCFDRVASCWIQLSTIGKGDGPNINNSKGSFNCYTSRNNGIKYCIFLDDNHSIWVLNTESLQWKEISYILPSSIPPLEKFTQIVSTNNDHLYIIGGIGSNVDNNKQISDDIYSFPIGEVIESLKEKSLIEKSSSSSSFGLPDLTCFTCGSLSLKTKCSQNCTQPIHYCSSKCEFKGISKHKCKKELSSKDKGPILDRIKSLKKDKKLLELEKKVYQEDLIQVSNSDDKEELLKKIELITQKITNTLGNIAVAQEGKLCPVCWEEQVSHVYHCGHQICSVCVKLGLKKCPTCRKDITKEPIRLFN